MDCRLGLCGWRMYLNYLFYEVRLFTSTYTDLLLAVATFAFYTGVALAIWSWWIQEGSFSGFKSGASSLAVKVVRYIPERVGIILPKDALEEKYDVDGAYGDPKALTTGLLQDLKHAGIRGVRKNVFTLLQVAMQKGKPVDDKLMTVS